MKELGLYSINNPGLGGNSHDLRKWSKTQRNLYSFDNMDDDSDENFSSLRQAKGIRWFGLSHSQI